MILMIMVTACPTESDPRLGVEQFVKDPLYRVLAGLRTEGADMLMDVVKSEIEKQYPDSNIIVLSRESISDGNVYFARDLQAFVRKHLDQSRMNNVLIYGDLAIDGWQNAFIPLADENIGLQVFFSSLACRAVPLCGKLL